MSQTAFVSIPDQKKSEADYTIPGRSVYEFTHTASRLSGVLA